MEYYFATDQGTREYQQDAGYAEITDDLAMAVLCDGMGGMNGGELASGLGVRSFSRDVKEAAALPNIPAFLEKEARRLDRMVYDLKDQQGNRLNAGSTIVSVVVRADQLYWMSVGDSRIYLLREGRLRCLTAAHNYKTMLQEKLRQGMIDMEYYNAEIRQGEALISYLGLGSLTLIDQNTEPLLLQEGDVILLCSDGLYKTLSDEQIQALIWESGSSLALAGKRLMETAGRLGSRGRDNTTLILLKAGQGVQ